MAILKIKNATFGNAVKIGNKVEGFVAAERSSPRAPKVDLEYDSSFQLLFIKHAGGVTLVGITNIKEMTLESEASGDSSGTRKQGEANKPASAPR